MTTLRLHDLNSVDAARFEALLGDVVEHSSWVARAVAQGRPYTSIDELAAGFRRVLREAVAERQLAVIRAHPDLGARLDALTAASASEQRGAGLDDLSPAGRERLRELNDAYKVKFGFPFIFAVAGAGPDDILAAFEARLPNDPDIEIDVALRQVGRIVGNRLRRRVG